MRRPINDVLDQYCLARSQRHTDEQVGLANLLVDEYIPDLIQRLGTTMIERNEARDKIVY